MSTPTTNPHVDIGDLPTPYTQLFATVFPFEKPIIHSQRILVLGSINGTLPAYLAILTPYSQIHATDLTCNSLKLISQVSYRNNLPNIKVFPDLANPDSYLEFFSNSADFDVAFIQLPKGRKVARRLLLQAFHCLKKGGILYLFGAKDEGVHAVAKDANELYSQVNVLAYKKGARLYRAMKQYSSENLPGWTSEAGISPGTWNEFQVEIQGQTLTLHTLPGVFSYDHLDAGTKLLLDSIEVPSTYNVLDIGCGCGIIGMVASRLSARHVSLSDNHLLSIVSTIENLRLNRIQNASVYASDLFTDLPDSSYQMILSNPPFHTGKQVDYQVAHNLITRGYQKLERGGSLIVVSNLFIRYQHLMNQIFGNVKTIRETKKFHVLLSQKP